MKTWVLMICLLGDLTWAHAGDAPKLEAKTGDYSTGFPERSPLSAPAEVLKRVPGFPKSADYKISDETWAVSVPASYKPSAAYGLLVFISSTDDGNCPGEIKGLLEAQKLIYVAPHKSGNDQSPIKRISLCLDAVLNMKKIYNIDPDRVYVSGISGGGRATSHLAPAFPDVFNGALYFCGCNPMSAKLPPDQLERMKVQSGFVFMTGDKDMNLQDTKTQYAQYQRLKFLRTTLLQVPDMGHTIPPTDWIKKGIAFLDEPLATAAVAQEKQALDLQKREKFGQALKLFYKVAAHAGDSPAGKEANEQVSVLEKKRDDILAQAQQLIDGGKGGDAVNLLDKLVRDYEDNAGNAKELIKKAKSK